MPTVIIKDKEVALAAPTIPNLGINIIFSNVFIKVQRALILNAMFTFPIFDIAPPTEARGA